MKNRFLVRHGQFVLPQSMCLLVYPFCHSFPVLLFSFHLLISILVCLIQLRYKVKLTFFLKLSNQKNKNIFCKQKAFFRGITQGFTQVCTNESLFYGRGLIKKTKSVLYVTDSKLLKTYSAFLGLCLKLLIK